MKKLHIIFILSLFAQMLWSQDYKGEFLFENKEIKVENDSLFLYFNIHIRGNAVPSCTSMNIIPELITKEGESYQFPYVQINGKSKYQMYKRWMVLRDKRLIYPAPYMQVNVLPITDTMLTYNTKISYQPWMDKAKLYINQEVWGCADEHQLFTFMISDNLHQDTIRYETNIKLNNIPSQVQKEFSIGGQILFEQSSEVPGSYQLAKLRKMLSGVINQDIDVIDLQIKGYASPEGEYLFNEHLAQQRAMALEAYLINTYNLIPSTVKAEIEWIAEDWDGLSLLVQDSKLLQRDAVLSIIDNVENRERRKIELKQLSRGIPYKTMYTNMFPLLRRAEYQITFRTRNANL